jgi:hypothetical protein
LKDIPTVGFLLNNDVLSWLQELLLFCGLFHVLPTIELTNLYDTLLRIKMAKQNIGISTKIIN